jgi:hypothetical protein
LVFGDCQGREDPVRDVSKSFQRRALHVNTGIIINYNPDRVVTVEIHFHSIFLTFNKFLLYLYHWN